MRPPGLVRRFHRPPGNETRVVDYIRKVFDASHPYIVAAKEPARANIIARLQGTAAPNALLIVGHSDTVRSTPRVVPRSAPRSTAATSMDAARSTISPTSWPP